MGEGMEFELLEWKLVRVVLRLPLLIEQQLNRNLRTTPRGLDRVCSD